MKKDQNKQGFALVSIISIIAVLSLAFGAFMFSGSQQTFTTKRMINRTKALVYAEAGIDYAFSKLSTDFSNRYSLAEFGLNGETPSGDAIENAFGDGSFSLSLTATNGNRYCVVTSVGKCGGQEVTAEIVAEDFNADTGGSTPAKNYNEMDGFKYPILCGGDLFINGDVLIKGSNKKVHANSEATYTNQQAQNNENEVTSSATEWGGPKVPAGCDNNSLGVANVGIPEIDLTPWENMAASSSGSVINKGDTIPNPVIGGVLVVNGNGDYTIPEAIGATIIFTGTGTISISGAYDPGNDFEGKPNTLGIVIKNTGDLKLTGGNAILGGITYVPKGKLSAKGTPIINGQLLVKGSITLAGTADSAGFGSIIPTPPGTPASETPYEQDVYMGAWQR